MYNAQLVRTLYLSKLNLSKFPNTQLNLIKSISKLIFQSSDTGHGFLEKKFFLLFLNYLFPQKLLVIEFKKFRVFNCFAEDQSIGRVE